MEFFRGKFRTSGGVCVHKDFLCAHTKISSLPSKLSAKISRYFALESVQLSTQKSKISRFLVYLYRQKWYVYEKKRKTLKRREIVLRCIRRNSHTRFLCFRRNFPRTLFLVHRCSSRFWRLGKACT